VVQVHLERRNNPGEHEAIEQMEATHKTSLAKGEVGLRDRKPAPTLREFAEGDFLAFVRSAFAAKPKTLESAKTPRACFDSRRRRPVLPRGRLRGHGAAYGPAALRGRSAHPIGLRSSAGRALPAQAHKRCGRQACSPLRQNWQRAASHSNDTERASHPRHAPYKGGWCPVGVPSHHSKRAYRKIQF
jgi:hypothetical protein